MKVSNMKSSNEKLRKKVETYMKKAQPLFENLILTTTPKKEINLEKIKKEFYEMAMAYYKDAQHFYEKNEYGNSLAALEYAEGWLDAGKALRIFKIKKTALLPFLGRNIS
jgi:hypothetical protein